MRAPIACLALLSALLLTTGCKSVGPPLQTVAHVDLARYMGDWYVIANIPYFAEKGCFDSVESYALRADGEVLLRRLLAMLHGNV